MQVTEQVPTLLRLKGGNELEGRSRLCRVRQIDEILVFRLGEIRPFGGLRRLAGRVPRDTEGRDALRDRCFILEEIRHFFGVRAGIGDQPVTLGEVGCRIPRGRDQNVDNRIGGFRFDARHDLTGRCLKNIDLRTGLGGEACGKLFDQAARTSRVNRDICIGRSAGQQSGDKRKPRAENGFFHVCLLRYCLMEGSYFENQRNWLASTEMPTGTPGERRMLSR